MPPSPPPGPSTRPAAQGPATAAAFAAAADAAQVRPMPATSPSESAYVEELRKKAEAGQESGTMLIAQAPPEFRPAATQASHDQRDLRAIASPKSQQAMAMFIDKCSACHGPDGYGEGPWSTEFKPHPANLSLVNDSPAMLRSIVLNGIPGTMMPAFPDMANETMEQMFLYVGLQPRELGNQWSYPWELQAKLGEDVEKPDTKEGKQLFANFCSGCHGDEGRGDGIMAKVATIWPKPADLTARSSDVGRLYYIISEGRPGTFMPYNKDKIPGLGRWQLAYYVKTLYKPDAQATMQQPKGQTPTYSNPYLRADAKVADFGRQRYALWCAPCHGDEGRGTFLAPRLIDRDWKYGAGSDTAVFTIVEEGIPGRLMLSFKKLEANERWAIITFLRHKGGLPDPLAEGSDHSSAPRQDQDKSKGGGLGGSR